MVRICLEKPPPLVGCGLGRDFVSIVSVSFLLAWEDASGVCRVDFSSLGLLSSALTLATISSACSLVVPIAFKYSSRPLLFELGEQFVDCSDMFPLM